MDALLVAYVSVTALLAATPGATTAVVIGQTLAGGRRAGYLAAGGAALGNVTQAACAGLGVAVLLQRSPTLLGGVRLAGALYLLWLALRTFTAAARGSGRTLPQSAASAANRSAFRQGLVTNLLNPSIVTFYVAVVPSFVPPGAGPARFALLASLHVVIAFACHVAWATLLDRLRALLAHARVERMLQAATGAALVWLAVRMI
jgi:threonine/homoserine/homoserine lactone efflux protein